MAMKYELKKTKGGHVYFTLKTLNGQVILASEIYKVKSGAKDGIELVQINSPDDNCYERKKSKDGQDFFILKARNNQVIGMSEMYSSASAMENGIESIKKNGSTTNFIDFT